MQQAPQVFQLADLTGQDIEAIMTGLNELPSKQSRVVMNKLETQIIQQVQAQNAAVALAASKLAAKADKKTADAEEATPKAE